ncbi:MAG: enoyl-CoA hydratase/isomerase family protein [Eggerthella lenta]
MAAISTRGPRSNRAPRARARRCVGTWPYSHHPHDVEAGGRDGGRLRRGRAFALVCASDLVCASERALFVPAFCQIGIVPEMGMMKLLPDLVGRSAQGAAVLRRQDPALQLYDWGVVNRVFPTETLEADTLWFARQLAGMPDASIHLTKNIMNALADGNLEACLEAESTASPFCTTTKAYAATMEKFAR